MEYEFQASLSISNIQVKLINMRQELDKSFSNIRYNMNQVYCMGTQDTHSPPMPAQLKFSVFISVR